MATTFSVEVAHAEPRYAREAVGAAFVELDLLERHLSRFVEGSDAWRINRLRRGETAVVSLDTFRCLATALEVQRRTAGAFDVTYASAPGSHSAERLRLTPVGCRVGVTDDGVRVDLGGIGKGYGRTIRATCQVHTTTRGTAGSHELVVGTAGSIRTSEAPNWVAVFREPSAVTWDEWVRKGYLVKVARPSAVDEPSEPPADTGGMQAAETGGVEPYEIPVAADKSSLHYHLENFLDAARGTGKLNCPPPIALHAEAAVLRAIEAVEAEQLLPVPAMAAPGGAAS